MCQILLPLTAKGYFVCVCVCVCVCVRLSRIEIGAILSPSPPSLAFPCPLLLSTSRRVLRQEKPDVVVGTPSRILSHLQDKVSYLNSNTLCVLLSTNSDLEGVVWEELVQASKL